MVTLFALTDVVSVVLLHVFRPQPRFHVGALRRGIECRAGQLVAEEQAELDALNRVVPPSLEIGG